MARDIRSSMKTMCCLVRGERSRSASWDGVNIGNLDNTKVMVRKHMPSLVRGKRTMTANLWAGST